MRATYSFVFDRRKEASKRDDGTGVIELLIKFSDGTNRYRTTKVRILPKYWDDKRKRIKKNDPYYELNNSYLNDIEYKFKTIERKSEDFCPADMNEKKRIKHPKTLNQYFQNFLDNERRLSATSIKAYQQSLDVINDFNPSIPVGTINKKLVIEFDEFLYDRKYAPSTIAKHHKVMKKYMLLLRDTLNLQIPNPYRGFSVPDKPNVDRVYLNPAELLAIYNCDLSSYSTMYQKARDIFLVLAYTGVRYSDLHQLNKSNISVMHGHDIFVIHSMKTTTKAIIPISPHVQEILDKYDYKLPFISDQKLNESIKVVAKMSGIDSDVPVILWKGNERKDIIKKKYELIRTHTARRSACTNMYYAGMPPKFIMNISGHKSEKAFFRYIIQDEDRDVVMALDNQYFRFGFYDHFDPNKMIISTPNI